MTELPSPALLFLAARILLIISIRGTCQERSPVCSPEVWADPDRSKNGPLLRERLLSKFARQSSLCDGWFHRGT